MKVVTRFESDDDRMWESFSIEVDGKQKFYMGISGDCPEDNTFGRSLHDVFTIPELMMMAYEAGENGEPLTFERIIEEE